MNSAAVVCAATLSAVLGASASAYAQRITNEIAVFAALDKVTARISRLEVALGQTVQFGSLRVTPRSCFTRPPTEQPKTTSFVEVQDTGLDGSTKPIFAGWMFAESPGLNAVEHPVFDVWLTDCAKPQSARAAAPTPVRPRAVGDAAAPSAVEAPLERRRVRR
jgi:hypothetical protein